MSNKRIVDELCKTRLDSGKKPEDEMYFLNEEYNSLTRTFKGTISYEPDTMKGVSEAHFVMTFSKDFSHIESGHKTTNLDDNKELHQFGKKKQLRYRRYKAGEEVPDW